MFVVLALSSDMIHSQNILRNSKANNRGMTKGLRVIRLVLF